MAYNIKQITNFTEGKKSKRTLKVVNGNIEEVDYKEFDLNGNAVKFGYTCEQNGLKYPIFLTINTEEKEFFIGKTRMLEMQPEPYINLNDLVPQEKTSTIRVTNFSAPENIKFTFDYILEVDD